MEPTDQAAQSASSSSSASASSSSSTIWEFSGAPTTSYSFFPVREEEEVAAEEAEDDGDRPSLLVQQQTGVGYHVHYPTTTEDEETSRLIRDDTWSCVIVVLTFWFFVSMTLILGVYGAVNLQLGSNCSLLITPNPLFVESIKVEQLDEANNGPILYGFYKEPPRDVDWVYILNEGSQINISYSVNSPSSSSLILIIAQDFSKGWHLCQLEVLDCKKVAWSNSVTEEKYCVEDCGWPLKEFAYECKINRLTGRTHQIQAQLAACCAPIVGDSMYMPAAIAEMIKPGLNPFGKYKKQCTSEYDKAMAMQEWISYGSGCFGR